ncbi:MAG: MarC family protein [Nostoc sp.]|uniref:MarC family protein n=1 Tax=Nostoc sp. TaxID=1180 RepID=UPI002FF5458B
MTASLYLPPVVASMVLRVFLKAVKWVQPYPGCLLNLLLGNQDIQILIMSLISNTLATFVALFPIANPIGAVPVFYSLTAKETSSQRHQQAIQTATNVVLVLAVFLVAGRWILEFFGISLQVLRLAGGLLVAHTAWEMVTVRQRLTPSENDEAMDKEDISFTPMAVPLNP